MSDAISPMLQWLNAHPNWAGFAAFIIAALESLAIIGSIIPGTVTMTAIGTLIGSGVIPLWSTTIWAIFGSIFGDNVSFWAGYYFKDGLMAMWPFRKYPHWIINGKDFFHRFGGMSVFIGRFIGPTRAIVPIVAGMLAMKPMRFIIASIIASTAWAPLYMLPGILLGQATLELPPDIAVQMVVVLLLASLFILLLIWLAYKVFWLMHSQTQQFLNWIWFKLSKSRHFHSVTTLLKHHDPHKTHGQLTLAFYFILVAGLFLALSVYVSFHNPKDIGIDQAFYYMFRSVRSAHRDNIMMWLTLLGDKKVLLPIAAIIFLWLLWKKCWHNASHVALLILITGLSIVFFKHLIHIGRPWGITNGPSSFSYPSGHATFSMMFYIGLLLFLSETINFKLLRTSYILIGIVIFGIGLSRLYLGAHWFTDVLGGWLLSTAILILITISYNRKKRISPRPQKYFCFWYLWRILVICDFLRLRHSLFQK